MDSNAVDAMIMAFSMFVFVIALTASMFLFKQVSATSEVLLYSADKTNYFENIEVNEDITTRTVNLDTVIPTLYRYYKENFCVKFYDDRTGRHELIHLFDVNIEAKVRNSASSTTPNNEQQALNIAYNDESKTTYLFESPWIGNTDEDTKTRVEFFIKGEAGYINDTYVDYSNGRVTGKINSLAEINQILTTDSNTELVESFIEYAFSGETITSEDGTETITGDAQENSKIVIIYSLRNKS